MNLDIRSLKILAVAYPFFIGMDIAWIGFLMNETYKTKLGSLARLNNGAIAPHIPASLLVWFLIVVGSYLFVLPHVANTTIFNQLLWGGVYGLILYGVYDLTNYAILVNWPLSITLIDLGWGIFANAILAVVLTFLNKIIH